MAKQTDAWSTALITKIIGCEISARARLQLALPDFESGNNLTLWSVTSETLYKTVHAIATGFEVNEKPAWQLVKEANMKSADEFWSTFVLEDRVQQTSRGSDSRPAELRVRWIRKAYNEERLHWNAIKPEETSLTLNDSQWQTMMIIRLGLEPPDLIPPCCAVTIHSHRVEHLLTCKCLSGFFTSRHNRVVHAVRRSLRTGGILSESTTIPALLKRENKDVGPDGLVYGPTRSIAYDVVVSHTSHLAHCYVPGWAAKRKQDKYAEMSKKFDWELAPFVMTSQGHPTADTLKFIAKMSQGSAIQGTKRRLMAATTIACVRGTADAAFLLSRCNENGTAPHTSSPTRVFQT